MVSMNDETTGSGVFGYARGSPTMVAVSGGSTVVVAFVASDCATAVAKTRLATDTVPSTATHLRSSLAPMTHLRGNE
jgi:hypothetical protein